MTPPFRAWRTRALHGLLLLATALGIAACAGHAATAPTATERQQARQAELARVLPMPADDQVQALSFDWTDAERAREVPARLYLPAAHDGAPLPLVVFSHGIGGSRQGYTWLGRYLATQGYASLHLQHVGSDNRLWRGNPLQLVGRLQGAATAAEALARVQDLSFALDRLLADPALSARIDASRIAAAGHSYGANTVLLAAGARVPDAPGALADPRLRAAVVISAPPFHGLPEPARIVAPIRVPSLHITAEGDTIRIPGFHSDVKDRIDLFAATGSAQKLLVVFREGSHSMFTDRLGTGGAGHNPAVKQATRELVVAFLDEVLYREPRGLNAWKQAHAALVTSVAGSAMP